MPSPTAQIGPGAGRTEHLQRFTEQFRSVFPRADQHRRFGAYLTGLLAPGGRKNVEGIAAQVQASTPAESDLVQALQHFLGRSPWDPVALHARCRNVLAAALADPAAVWVAHDIVFLKKGRHSVGVHRQLARPLGRKVNCQVGVALSQVGPGGYFPLAARLYLPAAWLKADPVRAERMVPAAHRQGTSKGALVIALIDEVRAGGQISPCRLVLDDGYESASDLLDALVLRGFTPLSRPDESAAAAIAETRRRTAGLCRALGLDQYEGRTWAGWHHHVSLVTAAHTFLLTEPADCPPDAGPPHYEPVTD